MNWDRFKDLLKSDLVRVVGQNKGLYSLIALKSYYVSESFKMCFWFRLGSVVAGVPAKIISTDSGKCFNHEWGEYFHYSYTTS